MSLRNTKPIRFWCTVLFLSGCTTVLALAGAAMIFFSVELAAPAVRACWYRSVRGTVVSAKLKSTVTGKINLHAPVIEYSYVVEGTPYRNSKFTPGDDDGTEDWAQGILERYPVGAPCTVYYDPSDPKTSALSPYATSRVMILAVLGSLLGAAHFLAALRFLCNPVLHTRQIIVRNKQKARRQRRGSETA